MPTIKQLAQNPLYYAHKQLLEGENATKRSERFIHGENVIYLEPREVFDAAIVKSEPVVYNFDKLIEVMMTTYDWGYIDALEWYCYNIEPLKYKGLKVEEGENADT